MNLNFLSLELAIIFRQISAHQAGTYPGFHSMKRLGVFLLPLNGLQFHLRATPSSKFAGTHLYTWVERGTESKVSYPRIERSAPARARARPPDPKSRALTIEATLNLRNFIVALNPMCRIVSTLSLGYVLSMFFKF